MRTVVSLFLVSAALLAGCAGGPPPAEGVVEESRMARVLDEIRPGTLVVLDIDNTLLAPDGHLGSDEWYDWLYEQGLRRGLSKHEAADRADAAFNRRQASVTVHAVDPATPAVLAKLRSDGVPFFMLTSRSTGVRDITVRQLAALRVEAGGAMTDAMAAKAVAALGHGSAWRDGVFFIGEGGLTKGEALLRIFDATGLRPERVVFVDDKSRNTTTVDASLASRGISHVCLRFSHKDAGVAAFRQDMAALDELATGEPTAAKK